MNALLAPTAFPLSAKAVGNAIRPQSDAVAGFAERIKAECDLSDCVLTDSGRSSLVLLLRWLRREQAGERRNRVLLPAYSCPSLVEATLAAGLTPVFCDLDVSTLGLDLAAVERELDERCLALIAVHLMGLPQPLANLMSMVADVGANLIEDAAQGLGACIDGRPAGSLGDYSIFSFGPGKPMALAGGGAIGCRHVEAGLRSFADVELTAPGRLSARYDALKIIGLPVLTHPRSWRLTHLRYRQRIAVGRTFMPDSPGRMSNPIAAAGTAAFSDFAETTALRLSNAARLKESLSHCRALLIPGPRDPEMRPNGLRFPVLVANPERREYAIRRLQRCGIYAGIMYGSSLDEVFPQYALGSYPGAQQLAQRLLTLPTHHHVRDRHIAAIQRVFDQCDRSVES